MKALFLVMDGMADMSHSELGWMTPLQAASTPNLDRLAREGCCALMYPLGPGICPSSEVAHWEMFGYRPEEFTGRAYLHALDAGLPCEPGDALFMFNLVAVERRREGVFIADAGETSIADVCSEWAERLARLTPGNMELHYMGGIEFIAVVRGGSCRIQPTDPFVHHRPVAGLQAAEGWGEDPETVGTLEALRGFMEKAGEELGRGADAGGLDLGLIMKWPSRAGTVEPFEARHGMRAAAVVSTPCFSGMAGLLSMRLERVGEGEAAVELSEKLRVAGDLLGEGWEFVFVHTKQADEAAHRGDPVAKKEIIEAMDGALAGCGISWEDPDLLTVITADHSTPTARDPRIIHGGDPVPVLFHAVTARRDGLVGFDEVSAASGAMGQLRGKDLMPLILYLTRKAPFYTGS